MSRCAVKNLKLIFWESLRRKKLLGKRVRLPPKIIIPNNFYFSKAEKHIIKNHFKRYKTYAMTLGWFTKVLASTVLSPLGRCSSRANTTQLAMMVNSTAYSNGVRNNWIKKKYTNNVILLIKTRSRRKKYTLKI